LKAAGVTQYMYVMNQLAIQKFKKGIEELELGDMEKERLMSALLNESLRGEYYAGDREFFG